MPPVKQNRAAFETLNGLRGVAAMAVVNAHFQGWFAGYATANVGLVVDFFFALSGFVLAYAYGDRLAEGMGTGRFFMARILRLYPMYLIGLAIGAAVVWVKYRWAGETHFYVSFGSELFFLPPPPALSSNDYNLFPMIFPAWSLFFELVANLLYGALGRRLNTAVLVTIIGLGLAGLVIAGSMTSTLDLGTRPGGFGGGLARAIFSFFAGVAVFRIWRASKPALSLHPVVLFALLLLPLLYVPAGRAAWIYDLGVIVLYFPVLIFLGAQSRSGPVWTAVCAALGALSYPLYVLHAPIADWVRAYADKALVAHAPWSGLAMLVGLATLAWLADLLIDLPVRRWLSGLVRANSKANPL